MSSREKRWFSRSGALSALTLLIVYGNIAALNAQFAANFPAVPALPVIDLLVDPFFLFGMFNGYERQASELVIQGFRAGAWRTLDAGELLPGPKAEYPIWVQAHRTIGELLPEHVILDERARYLARIRKLHNGRHPDQQVSRIRVGMLLWPKSDEGREALRVAGHEELSLLYEE